MRVAFFSVLLAVIGTGVLAHAEPLRVGIPGLSAEFAPVWAANDRGFLKKYGFESEIIAMQGGTQLAQAVIGGSIPIAVMVGAYLSAAVRGARTRGGHRAPVPQVPVVGVAAQGRERHRPARLGRGRGCAPARARARAGDRPPSADLAEPRRPRAPSHGMRPGGGGARRGPRGLDHHLRSARSDPGPWPACGIRIAGRDPRDRGPRAALAQRWAVRCSRSSRVTAPGA